MVRPRQPKITIPLHVHCTMSKGRKYYSFHPFRGTARAGTRVKLPGEPMNADGTPNNEFWAAYRKLMGGGGAESQGRHLCWAYNDLQAKP